MFEFNQIFNDIETSPHKKIFGGNSADFTLTAFKHQNSIKTVDSVCSTDYEFNPKTNLNGTYQEDNSSSKNEEDFKKMDQRRLGLEQ